MHKKNEHFQLFCLWTKKKVEKWGDVLSQSGKSVVSNLNFHRKFSNICIGVSNELCLMYKNGIGINWLSNNVAFKLSKSSTRK